MLKLSKFFPTEEYDYETPRIEIYGPSGYVLIYDKKFFLKPEELQTLIEEANNERQV